jgi:hypothetical protein
MCKSSVPLKFREGKAGHGAQGCGHCCLQDRRWDEMKAAVILYASENNLKQEAVGEAEAA